MKDRRSWRWGIGRNVQGKQGKRKGRKKYRDNNNTASQFSFYKRIVDSLKFAFVHAMKIEKEPRVQCNAVFHIRRG